MKFVAVCALLVSSAAAFSPPSLTFAVGKKAPAKTGTKVVAKAAPVKKAATKAVAKAAPVKKVVAKAAPVKKVVAKAAPVKKVVAAKPKPVVKAAPAKKSKSFGTVPSLAIPGEEAPASLDGSLIGDVGFDPCFLASKSDLMADYFNGIFASSGIKKDGLSWYREAELMNGRLAMVAVVGFAAPGFGTLSGSDWTGVDAYSQTNPLLAISQTPGLALAQIFAFMSWMEFRRINIIRTEGNNYMIGDFQKWGPGPGERFNLFNLGYTPEEYAEKQLQELKHCRLAMIGFLGLVFQANASGVGVVEQWSTAFTAPDYYARAGYFLPEGI